ncbi:MAG: hypothetical protein II674_05545 [Prevotella sp.]|nr:hypothetical protein [Prevotella sp.]
MLAFAAVTMQANDGVYYVNGNQLVPVRETDIAVVKEVLTISLCDDGYASVDVQYEFMNRGKAKTHLAAVGMDVEPHQPLLAAASSIPSKFMHQIIPQHSPPRV